MGRTRIDELSVSISADTSGLRGDLNRAQVDLNNLKKSVESGSRDMGGARAAAREASAHRRAAKEAAESWRAAAGSAGTSFAKIAGANLVANAAMSALQSTGMGLVDVFRQVKDSVRLAADIEQSAIAFEVLLGDVRAADQIIPSLKMLGNITAGLDNTTLGEMAYLYGTLATQGRAYTMDINQFANKGIRIWDALAKETGKEVEEMKQFTEEGRSGFPIVGRALESLQKKGGPFHGMLEKQSQSFKGMAEQMSDAWDTAKAHLGKIIVEETGLKELLRDFEALGKNVDGAIDRIRPAVRLVADFGKAVGHVGYEFGVAALRGAEIFGEMASELPEFKGTLDTVNAIVQGLKDFKIDPDDVTKLGVAMSKDVLMAGGSLAITIGEIGAAFKTEVLDPIRETVKELGLFKKGTVENYKGARDLISGKTAMELGARWRDAGPSAMVADLINGKPLLPKNEVKKDSVPVVENGLTRLGNSLVKLSNRLDTVGDAIIHKEYLKGIDKENARRKAEYDSIVADAIPGIRVRKALQGTPDLPATGVGGLNALGGIGTSPLHELAAGMPGFRGEMDRAAGVKLIPWAGERFTGDGASALRFEDKLDPHLLEMMKSVKEDYNPFLKLDKRLTDLDTLRDKGRLTQQEWQFGRDKEIGETAKHMGIGGEYKLPDAAAAGSAESVRILNAWQAGNGGETTEDLLREIREGLKQRDMKQTDFERNARAIGASVVRLPF